MLTGSCVIVLSGESGVFVRSTPLVESSSDVLRRLELTSSGDSRPCLFGLDKLRSMSSPSFSALRLASASRSARANLAVWIGPEPSSRWQVESGDAGGE